MHRLRLLLQTQLLTVLVLTGVVVTISMPAFADVHRQEVYRLDGYSIYFSEEDREASPYDRSDEGASHFAGLLSTLGAKVLTLDWREGIPEEADLVVMAGPVRYVGMAEWARLWHYLSNGGAVLLFADPLAIVADESGNLMTDINRSIPTELFDLTWQDFGSRARGDVVVIESGSSGLNADIIATDTDLAHPITVGLREPLAFFTARSIAYDASIQSFRATPLVFASDDYYGEASFAAYLLEGAAAFNIGIDTPRGPLALAVASENLSTRARLVIVGDRDFVTNGKGLQTSPANSAGFLYPGNAYFLVNAVGWLVGADSAPTDQLSFPTPGPTASPTPVPTPTPTLAVTSTP
ncbi:MAG: hypothetical protein AB1435_12310 [Chloroflexota bacterium]|jgi:hypothetical protein